MALSDLEAKVCRGIGAGGAVLLEDLRLHVGIPTGGNNPAGLDETRERLCSRLSRLGAKVELVAGDPKPEWLYGVEPGGYVPPTAVCRRDSGITGRGVLLSGHLDTVHDPAGPFRELSVAPDGKTATGPGCVDMKGGLVIAVAALEALEEAGVRVPWTFVLNSDEETGSYCSERALRDEAARVLRDAGERGGGPPPVALVLEPATPEGGLVLERAGSGQFVFEVRGRSAHVGRDFVHGISAVTALARCIADVSELPDPARGIIANIGPLEGGVATNVVADFARAWGNVRFPDKAGAEALQEALEGIARRHTEPGGLPSVAMHASFIRAAKPVTEGTRWLAEQARAVAEDLGQKLPFSRTNGVCDGNILQDAGLACIDTVGVRGGGLHTPQEWIDVASLVERCQMLAVLLMRLGDRR